MIDSIIFERNLPPRIVLLYAVVSCVVLADQMLLVCVDTVLSCKHVKLPLAGFLVLGNWTISVAWYAEN